MKTLFLISLSLISFSIFATDYKCVDITPIKTDWDHGYGKVSFNKICADIKGKVIKQPRFIDSKDPNENETIIVVRRLKMKMDGTKVCKAFGLKKVSKRKNIEVSTLGIEDIAIGFNGKSPLFSKGLVK
ncbi:hypothetical protein N9N67_11120, partial [Bacteriovoracaceae bacterium]|nr:hypothetical protein [Bacteriovoracaceae bacterium]